MGVPVPFAAGQERELSTGGLDGDIDGSAMSPDGTRARATPGLGADALVVWDARTGGRLGAFAGQSWHAHTIAWELGKARWTRLRSGATPPLRSGGILRQAGQGRCCQISERDRGPPARVSVPNRSGDPYPALGRTGVSESPR